MVVVVVQDHRAPERVALLVQADSTQVALVSMSVAPVESTLVAVAVQVRTLVILVAPVDQELLY